MALLTQTCFACGRTESVSARISVAPAALCSDCALQGLAALRGRAPGTITAGDGTLVSGRLRCSFCGGKAEMLAGTVAWRNGAACGECLALVLESAKSTVAGLERDPQPNER
jgi:hypothetical protein